MNARVTNLTGLSGGKVLATTDATTPPTLQAWHAIQVITDAVIAAITSNLESDTALVGVTLPAGTVLYGEFTAITLILYLK
jgi:hypothetical protein